MNIAFVLPMFTRQPIGGYKIVFEYANRFCAEGHNVEIVFLNEGSLAKYKLPQFIKRALANVITQIEPRWFPLNRKIKKISSLESGLLTKLINVDAVFATGVETVPFVRKNFVHSKQLYLIQGYEDWRVSVEELHNTYKLGMHNLVISTWLETLVNRYSTYPATLIRNPIDTSIYRKITPQTERINHSVGVLFHNSSVKGLKYGIEALLSLRKKYPDLHVEMFGIPRRPKELPDWIHYTHGASQQQTVEIYNKVQVFMSTSIQEGFGLTGLEAMACGAALVTTANQGALEYAIDQENALLSPIKDAVSLSKNVSQLFESAEKREYLTYNALETIKEYSWTNAMTIMESVLQ